MKNVTQDILSLNSDCRILADEQREKLEIVESKTQETAETTAEAV